MTNAPIAAFSSYFCYTLVYCTTYNTLCELAVSPYTPKCTGTLVRALYYNLFISGNSGRSLLYSIPPCLSEHYTALTGVTNKRLTHFLGRAIQQAVRYAFLIGALRSRHSGIDDPFDTAGRVDNFKRIVLQISGVPAQNVTKCFLHVLVNWRIILKLY